jgi:CRP/FNR family transcriptional regulator, cyclic AMP receptor protein
MTRVLETLGRMPVFASLGVDEVRAIDGRCIWRKFGAGEWVIDYQSDGTDVFFVHSGQARVVIVTSGREIILRDIHGGEYFGEFSAIDGKPRSAAIRAIVDTIVARMSAVVFWETIRRHPDVCEKVLKSLVVQLRTLNDRTNEHANLDVRHRLCSELLRLSRTTTEGRIVISPPPTHAELAARISSHREAVTKFLNALERSGLISRSPSAIVLTDAEGLRRVVAEEA